MRFFLGSIVSLKLLSVVPGTAFSFILAVHILILFYIFKSQ